jgi:hypothetical protein
MFGRRAAKNGSKDCLAYHHPCGRKSWSFVSCHLSRLPPDYPDERQASPVLVTADYRSGKNNVILESRMRGRFLSRFNQADADGANEKGKSTMNHSMYAPALLDPRNVRAHRRNNILAKLLLLAKVEQKHGSEAKTETVREGTICEPEPRLWKVTAQTTAHHFAVIDLFILLLFLALAIIGIADCSLELSRLLGTDAIGHIAAKAINP